MPSTEIRLFLFATTFSATFLLPLLNALFLFKMKYIQSLQMETKQERKIPYLASAIFYFTESYFLMNMDVSALVKALMFGATMLVVAVFVINLFWKISAHLVALGGLTGMLIAISYRLEINLHFFLIVLFITAGIVAWARLKLSSHTPAQVYAGFLLGVVAELILFL